MTLPTKQEVQDKMNKSLLWLVGVQVAVGGILIPILLNLSSQVAILNTEMKNIKPIAQSIQGWKSGIENRITVLETRFEDIQKYNKKD